MRAAVKAYGRDARFEVENETQIRVRFAENSSFVAAVTERWSGWWITSVDVGDLRVPKPDPSDGNSWWRRDGGGG
jgi:hypothetical protein